MKYLKWIGALIVFLMGVKLATDSRRLKQRSEDVTTREIKELSKGKATNLKKAKRLGAKAEALFKKADDAKTASEARVQQLENADATTLADRMRDFNKRL